MVQGTTHQGINVRKTSKVETGNIDRAISAGVSFLGELVTGLDGKQWIELSKLAGLSVSNLFIAAWVVNYTPVVVPPVDPPAASEIPAYFDLTTPDGVRTRYNRA